MTTSTRASTSRPGDFRSPGAQHRGKHDRDTDLIQKDGKSYQVNIEGEMLSRCDSRDLSDISNISNNISNVSSRSLGSNSREPLTDVGQMTPKADSDDQMTPKADSDDHITPKADMGQIMPTP